MLHGTELCAKENERRGRGVSCPSWTRFELAIRTAEVDALPGAQVQTAVGDGDRDGRPKERRFRVACAIVRSFVSVLPAAENNDSGLESVQARRQIHQAYVRKRFRNDAIHGHVHVRAHCKECSCQRLTDPIPLLRHGSPVES